MENEKNVPLKARKSRETKKNNWQNQWGGGVVHEKGKIFAQLLNPLFPIQTITHINNTLLALKV